MESYKRAANAGDAEAIHNLALLLQNGSGGIKQDTLRAARLFERAEDGGNVKALKTSPGSSRTERKDCIRTQVASLNYFAKSSRKLVTVERWLGWRRYLDKETKEWKGTLLKRCCCSAGRSKSVQ